jgi:hypothetical protein
VGKNCRCSSFVKSFGKGIFRSGDTMTLPVQQLLRSFDALPDADKHEAAVEILRRCAVAVGDVPDDALRQVADELFVALDEESPMADPAGRPAR